MLWYRDNSYAFDKHIIAPHSWTGCVHFVLCLLKKKRVFRLFGGKWENLIT